MNISRHELKEFPPGTNEAVVLREHIINILSTHRPGITVINGNRCTNMSVVIPSDI